MTVAIQPHHKAGDAATADLLDVLEHLPFERRGGSCHGAARPRCSRLPVAGAARALTRTRAFAPPLPPAVVR
jgi:hypothetical protein